MNTNQRRSVLRWYFTLAVAVTLLSTRIAFADGLIHGYIIGEDSNGANSKLIDGALVEMLGPGGISLVSTKTNEHGYYSASGIPAGTYVYRVTADGYSDCSRGRSIELKAVDGVHVLDFFLSKDTEEKIEMGTVSGRVEQVIGGTPTPLEGATIAVRDKDGKVRTFSTDVNGEYDEQLPIGPWRVSAKSLGFDTTFHPAAITIAVDGRETVDFLFEEQTTPVKPASEVRALVSVQQFDAPKPERTPEVQFMVQNGASTEPIPGKVRLLSEKEFGDLGIPTSGSWLWFEALPTAAIPTGNVHVEARLEPFDAATSDTKQTDSVISTYFDVTLRHKTPEELNDDPDPTEIDPTKVAIHGYVIGEDEDGKPTGLIPSVQVEFMDANGVVVGTDKTNEHGYYFVHSMVPGDYQYRLAHRRYRTDNDGHGFALSADTGLHVLDFFITQSKEKVDIGTLVGTALNEDKGVVQGASVIVFNAEDPNSRKILSLNHKNEFATTLADGTWLATATAPGHTCVPVAVTIESGKEAKAELTLKKKDGPAGDSSIEALVAVQRFDHKSGASGTPTVKFVRASDEQFVAATVRKLTGEEAEGIGASSGSWEYFIANPASSLSGAEYFVTGEMEDYHPAKSGSQYVDPLSVVSFHITLRSTKADEPDDRPLLVGGYVKHVVDGKELPVPNATVSLHNGETGTTVELTTGTDGRYYDRNIARGEWWATAVAVGFLPHLHPEAIQVAPTKVKGEVRYITKVDDIFLKKIDTEGSEHQTYAIVAIEKAEASEVAGTPTVNFVNVATKQKVAGKLQSIDDEIENAGSSSWVWYDAVPVSPLPAGKYRVTGELENFRSDISKEKPVADDITTTFNVSLRSKKIAAQPGLLVATVWRHQEATKGGETLVHSGPSDQLAYDATVVFRNPESGQIVYAEVDEDGNYAAELLAGRWQASAKVEGLEAAITPSLIRVFEGKQSFCKLVINVPAPKPVELPKVFAFVGVERPNGNSASATSPNVQFVPSDAHGEHGVERGSRYRLFLYKDFNGPERLQDSSKITGELPSWTNKSEKRLPGSIGLVDVKSPSVRAAAERAVALLNRKQQTNYVLDQVLFCGSQALPGEVHHLICRTEHTGRARWWVGSCGRGCNATRECQHIGPIRSAIVRSTTGFPVVSRDTGASFASGRLSRSRDTKRVRRRSE